MQSSQRPLIIWMICVLGAVLRIYNLDDESLWRDEVSSVVIARLPLGKIIETCAGDVHPPLYFFILHYWIVLWGNSEFSVRLLSAIFGSLSLWPMYKIGCSLFNQHVGALSTVILALAEFHLHYSQEARGYSLMTLLILLSFLSLIRLLKGGNLFTSASYVLVNTLLIYTHVYGHFIVIGQNLFFLLSFFSPNGEKAISVTKWLTLQSAPLVFYLPWIGVFVHQVQKQQDDFWIKTPTVSSIEKTFSAYAGSRLSFAFFLSLLLLPYVWHSAQKIMNDHNLGWRRGALKGIFRPQKRGESRSLSLLVVWLLTPILFPFAISQLTTPLYLTRGTIGASCAFYILVAKGVESVQNTKTLYPLLIGLVLLFSTVNLYQYYTKTKKEQWREVTYYVNSRAERGDLVLFYPPFCQEPFDYYSRRADLIKISSQVTDGEDAEANRRKLRVMAGERNATWVILCDDRAVREKTTRMMREVSPLLLQKSFVEIELLKLDFAGVH